MTTDRAQLADLVRQLQEAYDRSGEEAQALTLSLYADQVLQTHTPPHPDDGLWDRAHLIARSEAGLAATRKMPQFRLTGKVSAEGDDLVVERIMEGTTDDGSDIRIRARAVYRVEDGRITRAHGYTNFDGQQDSGFAEVLTPPGGADE